MHPKSSGRNIAHSDPQTKKPDQRTKPIAYACGMQVAAAPLWLTFPATGLRGQRLCTANYAEICDRAAAFMPAYLWPMLAKTYRRGHLPAQPAAKQKYTMIGVAC